MDEETIHTIVMDALEAVLADEREWQEKRGPELLRPETISKAHAALRLLKDERNT